VRSALVEVECLRQHNQRGYADLGEVASPCPLPRIEIQVLVQVQKVSAGGGGGVDGSHGRSGLLMEFRSSPLVEDRAGRLEMLLLWARRNKASKQSPFAQSLNDFVRLPFIAFLVFWTLCCRHLTCLRD
jgi:hypothetical protein